MNKETKINSDTGAEKVKPRQSYVTPLAPMKVDEAFEAFRAPEQGAGRVQILRPCAVYSSKSYSSPVTLPIGPAYLASTLQTAGYEVDIIDGVGEDMMNIRLSDCGRFNYQGLTIEAVLDRIDPNATILGISMMFSQTWTHDRKLVERIREKFPDLKIVVGGEHISAFPEYVMENCPAIDYAIVGEGELAFLELTHALMTNGDVADVPGLRWRDDDGTIVDNGVGRRIGDFENLPWPAWGLVPVENYFSGLWSMGIGMGRNMLILATRGCPYQCTFCSSPSMWTPRYMMRSAEKVVDEIEWLVKEYQCTNLDFADLTAIVKKDWVMEFCAELKRRNLNITWQLPSGTRSEALDHESLGAIYDAGCKFLAYAPESGSKETLEKIKKRLNLEKVIDSFRAAVEVGTMVKLCLIIGFPHERRSHIYKTMWYAVRAATYGVQDCNISPFTPYPGSELFQQCKDEGLLDEVNDEYFDDLIGQFDFTITRTYCPNVPGLEMAIYRFIGMSSFYALSYLLFPKRIWRVIKGIWNKDFTPGSLAEQRIMDYFGRSKIKK